MKYFEHPKMIQYPCQWKPTVVPGEHAVHMIFGDVEISSDFPTGTIDETHGTCWVSLVGKSSEGYLMEFPGEIDGTLGRLATVPEEAMAGYLEG